MAGFQLLFGAYADPSFVGMKAVITRSAPAVDGSGNVSATQWTVTIAADGTASVSGLPYNDDGTTYTCTWQALSYKPTPGNRQFQVPSSAGATVDYDTLQPITPGSLVSAPLDALVAALLTNPSSQTRSAAVNLPNYPGA